MMENKPLIICLTPIKNEAWILEKFIECASLWADYIIIADQMSIDGSRDIAKKFEKVILIDNTNPIYNEYERQKLLIEKARQIPNEGKKKLLITLDADEFLTANFNESSEWLNILEAPIGTVIYFSWINIRPDFKKYWDGGKFGWGIMDDEMSTNKNSIIHNPRIPIPENAPKLICRDIKVLHYQYVNWDRMKSKHRWYQCFELLNRKHLAPLSIFRMYHHMYGIAENQFLEFDKTWFTFYETQGIDMTSIKIDTNYWWDNEVEKYFEQYGRHYFSSLAIWDNSENDPRSRFQKRIHSYLFKTQIFYLQKSIKGKIIRQFDKILKFFL